MSRKPGRPRKSANSSGNVDILSELYKPIRVVGSKRLYQTAEDLANKINEYFEQLMYEKKFPCPSRLAAYLEFRSVSAFYAYKKYGDDYAEVIDKADLLIQAWCEEHLVGHHVDSKTVGLIFFLKNKYGWVDNHQSKTEHTLEIIPRERLEQELERKLVSITDARRTQELVGAAYDTTTDPA